MSVKPFKVMKGEAADFSILTFPKLANVKLDGIRCYIRDGVGFSTSNKPLPNASIQNWIRANAQALQNLDGELIVGAPNDPKVYNKTNSGVMSEGGVPAFCFYVFDYIEFCKPYKDRLQDLASSLVNFPKVRLKIVTTHYIASMEALEAFEADALANGYEGVMVRDPMGHYKCGKSTAREQGLNKIKRYLDSEACITGFKEEMRNDNEATISATGHTKRSTHKANKVGKETLGAFTVEGIGAPFVGLSFDVAGLTDLEALDFWTRRDQLVGKIIKFKYFPVGIKDLPRHPVFLGFRDEMDM